MKKNYLICILVIEFAEPKYISWDHTIARLVLIKRESVPCAVKNYLIQRTINKVPRRY